MSLERVKPTTFKYLSSLEVLDLSYNKLNHLYPPAIGYLPRLKQLWLAGECTLPAHVLVFFNSFFQKCFHPKTRGNRFVFSGQSWFCKNDLFWLLNVSKDPLTFKIMDFNRMMCGGYKYQGKHVMPVLRLLSVCFIYNCHRTQVWRYPKTDEKFREFDFKLDIVKTINVGGNKARCVLNDRNVDEQYIFIVKAKALHPFVYVFYKIARFFSFCFKFKSTINTSSSFELIYKCKILS